jgi:hypothetical protein
MFQKVLDVKTEGVQRLVPDLSLFYVSVSTCFRITVLYSCLGLQNCAFELWKGWFA